MTHVVELVIKRFYRVYVEDPDNSMSEDEMKTEAIRQAIDSENNLTLSEEMEIEEQDIVYSEYQYDID